MLTQEEDQQLVERVQRGDRRAFDLLVLKYQHKILGFTIPTRPWMLRRKHLSRRTVSLAISA